MAARCLRLCLVILLPLLCAPAATADEVYRIGAEDDWYPFTALREGKVQGMSADLVRAAFAASNTRVELVPYPYSRCMELTRTGRLAACFNTSPDADIASEFRLPQEPLFQQWIGAFVCSVGCSYLFPFFLPAGAARNQRAVGILTMATIVRIFIAAFSGFAIATGALETAWLSVTFTDATLAVLQLVILRKKVLEQIDA